MADLQPLNGQKVTFAKNVKIGDTEFYTAGKLKKTSNGSGIIGEQMLGCSAGKSNYELIYINQLEEPVLFEDRSDEGKSNIYLYTGLKFGVDSDNKALPPTLATDLFKYEHKISESVECVFSAEYFEQLRSSFKSNTTQIDDAVSGEAFAANDQLSLHTDGKFYKYHATNYPDWRGIAASAATAADETVSVFLTGYLAPGYSGLTQGASVYADNGGTTVQAPTATAKFIGYAESDTEVRLQSSAPSTLEKASQAEAEAGTDDAKYMTALKTKQSISENAVTEFSDEDFGGFSEVNYIEDAHPAFTIAEGVAGVVNATTSLEVRLAYKSSNGKYTEPTTSNDLGPVILKKIDIPVVASADSGSTGIGVEINIDSSGWKFWQDAPNPSPVPNPNTTASISGALTASAVIPGTTELPQGDYDVKATVANSGELSVDSIMDDIEPQDLGSINIAYTNQVVLFQTTSQGNVAAATHKVLLGHNTTLDRYFAVSVTKGIGAMTLTNTTEITQELYDDLVTVKETFSTGATETLEYNGGALTASVLPATNETKVLAKIDASNLTEERTRILQNKGGTEALLADLLAVADVITGSFSISLIGQYNQTVSQNFAIPSAGILRVIGRPSISATCNSRGTSFDVGLDGGFKDFGTSLSGSFTPDIIGFKKFTAAGNFTVSTTGIDSGNNYKALMNVGGTLDYMFIPLP